MDKSSIGSSGSSGISPSPGPPNNQSSSGGPYLKDWSSERLPLSAYSKRRISGSGLNPFNNGRTLPSKWEDAEKWIFSPVSRDGVGRQSMPPCYVRRPKSKSGPLGPLTGNSGIYSATSPLVPCFDSGRVGKFMARSPFIPEHECCANGDSQREVADEGDGERVKSYSSDGESYIARSSRIQGWSDTLVESSFSLPNSHGIGQDEKFVGDNEGPTISSALAFRDAATQMPERSSLSSHIKAPSISANTSLTLTHSTKKLERQFSKIQVRDVQVDDQVTITRWSKKRIARCSNKSSAKIVEWKKTMDTEGCQWELSETKSMSKYLREEAKITAWENLQKAKAEAEIRKLEMKLEKKRASSMDKILNKLKLAQKKAQGMRSAMDAKQANQFVITTKKTSYSYKKTGQMRGCFACPAF